jgi:predicted amidohydrolase YtcJ
MFQVGRKVTLFVFAVLLVSAGAAWAQQTVSAPAQLVSYPDLIIYNAKIVTMDDQDPNGTVGRTVQAMAVRSDKIQFMGTDAEILKLAGPQTRKLDLKGRTVIPGMINTHKHLHGGLISAWLRKFPEEQAKLRAMENRRSFDVTGTSFDELTKGIELVIKEKMTGDRPDTWASISLPSRGQYGFGIGTPYIIEGKMTRAQLDALAPNRPVSVSGEGVDLMNTKARNALFDLFKLDHTEEAEFFTMIGSGGNTPSNVSTGQGFAELFWSERIPMMADGLEDGLKHLAALGWTGYSGHLMGFRIYDAYAKLAREGRMPVRYGYSDRNCQVMVVDIATCFGRKQDMAGMGDPYFWNMGVTLGALDHDAPTICHSMEASPKINALRKCYAEPGGPYNDAIYAAIRNRLRYNVNHVMGDVSMDQFMDIIERAMKDDPGITLEYVRSRRFSADHCGWYPRVGDQLQRMARLNITISCGPKEIDDQGWFIPKVYGEKYANRIGPMASTFKAGVRVALEETNWDGLEDRPPTVFSASIPFMTRLRSDGVKIAAQEAINRVQLMKMLTTNGAWFVLKEKEFGTLEPGKLADFVVLSKDYFTIPEADIPTVIPLMTVVGGKTIVLRQELARDLGIPAVGPQLNFVFKAEGRGATRDPWIPPDEYLTKE